MSRILIIDDDRDFARSLQIQLEMEAHAVAIAHTGDDGFAAALAVPPDLILLDLKLRETDGLQILRRLQGAGITAPVVMITGEQDMQANIQAVRQGVVDYLRKPFSLDAVLDLLARLPAAASTAPPTDAAAIIPIREVSPNPREIVGADPAVLDLLKQLALLSRSRVSVLIQGESGTGKEVVGRALHSAACPDAPFVALNCTAVVPTLLESSLFGHIKGAFTGATETRPGVLAQAGDGTLFLDEIGDMPLDLQPKLLRVIQEREFTPVGGVVPQPFRARIVAVTHRDLEAMVADGDFREDLYYRLAVARLHVPPLRDRKGDLDLLATHLLWRITRDLGRPLAGITRAALDRLHAHDWPGNVRELENVLTRAAALAKTEVLDASDLQIGSSGGGSGSSGGSASGSGSGSAAPPPVTLADMERQHVLTALNACGWNITHTAERLGITRPTLRKKIEDFGLKPPAGG